MIAITEEAPAQPELAPFFRASEAYSASLYPAESNHMLPVAELAAAHVRFFVARLDGGAVGCAALVLQGKGEAELKRMFVADAARGRGAGRALLRRIEDTAHGEGVSTLCLETGIRNAEALALYRRAGFFERGPFGMYRPDPLSVFMEKVLEGRVSQRLQ
jgi:putative acetyltransferase